MGHISLHEQQIKVSAVYVDVEVIRDTSEIQVPHRCCLRGCRPDDDDD